MIIGLTGAEGAGKDSVAEILVRDHGFVRVAYADKLKELVLHLEPYYADYVKRFGWDVLKQVDAYLVRAFLQRTGQAVRDVLGADAWVIALEETMRQHRAAGHRDFVVSDVRYPNEVAEWMDELWLIERPGYGPVNDHPSAQLQAAKYADRVIPNSSDLKYLGLRVSTALSAAYWIDAVAQ